MREDYMTLGRTQHYVRASGKERKDILEMLKKKGFRISQKGCSEEMILESPFPITIDLNDMKIFLLGETAMDGDEMAVKLLSVSI